VCVCVCVLILRWKYQVHEMTVKPRLHYTTSCVNSEHVLSMQLTSNPSRTQTSMLRV